MKYEHVLDLVVPSKLLSLTAFHLTKESYEEAKKVGEARSKNFRSYFLHL